MVIVRRDPVNRNPSTENSGSAIEHLVMYDEAAKILGVTDRTVRTLVKKGKLPAVRFGRSVRFDPADLRNFIEQNKHRGIN